MLVTCTNAFPFHKEELKRGSYRRVSARSNPLSLPLRKGGIISELTGGSALTVTMELQ